MAGASQKRKKIRSTLACTPSFSDLLTIIHSRGQRYVVPLTTQCKHTKTIGIIYNSIIFVYIVIRIEFKTCAVAQS